MFDLQMYLTFVYFMSPALYQNVIKVAKVPYYQQSRSVTGTAER